MIPRAFITEWRSEVFWITDAQVEQDLILSRALIEIFSDALIAEQLAFRGGTALHKLFLKPAGRYSEDIDLVQIQAGPIGETMDLIRSLLDPWLGKPRRSRGPGSVTLIYRFDSEIEPIVRLRLKVEINTREHFNVLGMKPRSFAVRSSWFEGKVQVPVYQLEELLGTKMRALYQRKKGRDLYDLGLALNTGRIDPDKVVMCFLRYMQHGGHSVTRGEYETNLTAKLKDQAFTKDIVPLLAKDVSYDHNEAVTSRPLGTASRCLVVEEEIRDVVSDLTVLADQLFCHFVCKN